MFLGLFPISVEDPVPQIDGRRTRWLVSRGERDDAELVAEDVRSHALRTTQQIGNPAAGRVLIAEAEVVETLTYP
jgi:hypothetical protein